jgi:hypothetical protein
MIVLGRLGNGRLGPGMLRAAYGLTTRLRYITYAHQQKTKIKLVCRP